jgi:hypothetical protein
MLYARIQDGRVAELVDIDGDPAEHFHESLIFLPAPEGCLPGWILSDGALAAPPIDLEALRTAKYKAIDFAYRARIEAGLAYGGKVIQIDEESRSNISAIALRAALKSMGTPGITWPDDGYPWRTLENDWLPLSPPEFLLMAQQGADLYTAIRVRNAGLKDALAAAVDAGAIAAVDPAAGWPA